MSEADAKDCALEMLNIGKRFGENWVLNQVNLKVRRGGIHAIVGHNGAGKSTLMKIALGAEEPTEGEVRIGGRRLTYSRPAEARSLGLGMVMQERSLIATMTGIDNLFLNSERFNPLRFVDVRRERAEVEALIAQLGISPSLLSLRVSEMSTIEQELIEIARALRLGDRVLALDEPTAPLGREEISKLFDILRVIAARGTGIILITHHLAEVFAVSDEVTCLREGRVVMSCPTKETDMTHLIAAMLGRRPWAGVRPHAHAADRDGGHGERSAESDSASNKESAPSLKVRGLSVGAKLADVSFDAYRGEILGVVGLAGSGRTTLMRTLFGDIRPSAGEITLSGRPYRPKTPQHAMSRGVYLIPEDRGVHGLILSKSIAENLVLVALRRLVNGIGFLRFADGRGEARRLMKVLDIRASDVDQTVGELSGGNQQKVVLAKALAVDADLLLLDEPTFGVDIGASREIMSEIRQMAENGTTVLWASSDLLEITHVADRVLVLSDGIVSATVDRHDRHEFSEDSLVAMMQRRQFHPVSAGREARHATG